MRYKSQWRAGSQARRRPTPASTQLESVGCLVVKGAPKVALLLPHPIAFQLCALSGSVLTHSKPQAVLKIF